MRAREQMVLYAVLNGDTTAAKLELCTAVDVSALDERDIDAEVRLLANV